MSIKADFALAYQMGYDDALGHRRPEPRKTEDMADSIARENAKLRELAEDMLNCIEIRAAFGRPPMSEMCEEFAQRAAELGIEADE